MTPSKQPSNENVNANDAAGGYGLVGSVADYIVMRPLSAIWRTVASSVSYVASVDERVAEDENEDDENENEAVNRAMEMHDQLSEIVSLAAADDGKSGIATPASMTANVVEIGSSIAPKTVDSCLDLEALAAIGSNDANKDGAATVGKEANKMVLVSAALVASNKLKAMSRALSSKSQPIAAAMKQVIQRSSSKSAKSKKNVASVAIADEKAPEEEEEEPKHAGTGPVRRVLTKLKRKATA
ncbi:hypothetical protein GQ42DRAFT_171744 [Ramicandelaber brevisporus]|nr:hypothetical protein GQ42DRAFT_171744 [Ramicandelaber brevisporus]